MISECSDALVPQSGSVQSSGILRSDLWYRVKDVLKERVGFIGRVMSSRKCGYTVQCNLRFTTNVIRWSVVVLFIKAQYPVTKTH